MKIQVLNQEGKKVSEKETVLFEEPVRVDIIRKVVEAERIKHPNSPKYRAGMDISASGNTSKRRHVWKTNTGRGMARLPMKIFSRRGTQFNWQAAVVPSARGGRRAHPPHGNVNLNKVNKKELKKALLSSLSYVSSVDELKKKYSSLNEVKVQLPLVVSSEVLNLNNKDFLSFLNKILGDVSNVAVQKKTIRAGIGKMRGRKNKKNAGLLIVIGNDEEFKIKGVEVVKVNELVVSDLASNGARLCMFSEKGVEGLERIASSNKFEDSKNVEQSSIKRAKK
ncbi:50S ribosomal protein L4 [archaeon]|jgi:large subunit ribosomal protein L4e|nr:50S ribosomal protein L4 [archaeon]